MAANYLYNFEPTLKSLDTIEVVCNKNYDSLGMKEIRMYENGKFVCFLKFLSKNESKSTFIYTFSFEYHIQAGLDYYLIDGRGEKSPLNVSYLASLAEFEEKFRYDGKLGAIYSKEETTFRVFAPLASEIILKVLFKNEVVLQNMERLESGVYQAKVKKDCDGAKYVFLAKVNGRFVQAIDPYAFSLTLNSCLGVVINPEKVETIPLYEEKLPRVTKDFNKAIYEIDVRDMTSHLKNEEKLGAFALLAKEGLVDEEKRPLGMDYIKSLGFNYIQIMPIYDFSTIPDDYPSTQYNWGYDPTFYFAPEGSYASDPNDGYSRVLELRNLISTFHKNGMRVNMDVVFNHTFQVISNSFELLCPNYFYRKNEDGTLANGSGCGNDLETRNYMVRKMIVDCCKHFVTFFGIDGFRFDLMGLIDTETMMQVVYSIKGLKPNAMIYGEGWDMMTPLPSNEKTSLSNAMNLPDIGFFNNRFRDVSRGSSYGHDLSPRGYLTGDGNYIDGFKHVFIGSVISLAFPPLFTNPWQSINYIECHDDGCLYDKVKAEYPTEEEEVLLRRIKMANACTIFAFGTPFIHAGQEVGHSKQGICNSYNAGDEINGFDYHKAYERKDMIKYLQDALQLRTKYSMLTKWSKKDIIDNVNFENLSNGALAIKYSLNDELAAVMFINPSEMTVSYELPKYFKVVFNEAGNVDKEENYAQLVLINGLSVVLCIA